MTLKMIELFCGAGLFGNAFASHKFKAVFAADLDRDAINSYNCNSTNAVGHVHDVSIVNEVAADILVAGPPCQGFSTLGKRDSQDLRNALSLRIIPWAEKSKPSVIIVENVPQFLKSRQSIRLQKQLQKLGYESERWILNSKNFGAAQNRLRSFSIFSKIGIPKRPVETDDIKTVADEFEDLKGITDDPMHFYPPMTDLAKERIQHVPARGNKLDILKTRPDLCPESWIKIGHQATDVWGRMDADSPSNTIRCNFQNPSKGRYIHPNLDRVITLREGARLQGIPDRWRFAGARTSITRQIGNGVPIPLGSAVAKEILNLF